MDYIIATAFLIFYNLVNLLTAQNWLKLGPQLPTSLKWIWSQFEDNLKSESSIWNMKSQSEPIWTNLKSNFFTIFQTTSLKWIWKKSEANLKSEKSIWNLTQRKVNITQSETELEGNLNWTQYETETKGGVGRVRGGLDPLTQSETDIGLFRHNCYSHTPEFGQHFAKKEDE